ncbi:MULTISPECIES: DUF4183 domain-containing protein [Anoxybacillaceae]|uniref:DUF4183 domain-containing protein n=4 Tax=Anoxybacillaceae TaxID=3120669 RepID=A0AAN1D789_PARTM|nr:MULTISPECIES: DUF4183 domain-containing protein [Bacillaceae]KYD17073.1 hypothetical protein B4168_1473 [Anoxybacillus flavithermus]REK54162.1 MAG: DUF4183 domain-containing protein [Geobacillus sp.]AEH48085.1 hypothetical protein Geoth_2150 [Parageobacillus thermoglucosidasius C56-YS93]ALF10684.1 hypothetical protein AOT13_12030 [Parageobacillus thermoglucosidasius]ANZ30762.1 hypothetical protein BCV53_12040 [Parageobacillus thermoglucosidasius]
MALQLIKLFVSASTSTDAVPTDTRFFYITTAETAAGATLTIDAASFLQDDGNPATELPALAANNSYYNVYINGVLQMEGIATYTPGATGVGSLAINVPAGGDPIPANTPIVLEIVQFAPSSTTTVTT